MLVWITSSYICVFNWSSLTAELQSIGIVLRDILTFLHSIVLFISINNPRVEFLKCANVIDSKTLTAVYLSDKTPNCPIGLRRTSSDTRTLIVIRFWDCPIEQKIKFNFPIELRRTSKFESVRSSLTNKVANTFVYWFLNLFMLNWNHIQTNQWLLKSAAPYPGIHDIKFHRRLHTDDSCFSSGRFRVRRRRVPVPTSWVYQCTNQIFRFCQSELFIISFRGYILICSK